MRSGSGDFRPQRLHPGRTRTECERSPSQTRPRIRRRRWRCWTPRWRWWRRWAPAGRWTADSAAPVAVLDAPVAVVAAVGAGREVVAAVAAAVAASPAGSLLSGITTRERLATSLVVAFRTGLRSAAAAA